MSLWPNLDNLPRNLSQLIRNPVKLKTGINHYKLEFATHSPVSHQQISSVKPEFSTAVDFVEWHGAGRGGRWVLGISFCQLPFGLDTERNALQEFRRGSGPLRRFHRRKDLCLVSTNRFLIAGKRRKPRSSAVFVVSPGAAARHRSVEATHVTSDSAGDTCVCFNPVDGDSHFWKLCKCPKM